jgi:NAD-dependent dihydropyrimidine dehydrogenase PreA subunit
VTSAMDPRADPGHGPASGSAAYPEARHDRRDRRASGPKDSSCVELCPDDCIDPAPDEPYYDRSRDARVATTCTAGTTVTVRPATEASFTSGGGDRRLRAHQAECYAATHDVGPTLDRYRRADPLRCCAPARRRPAQLGAQRAVRAPSGRRRVGRARRPRLGASRCPGGRERLRCAGERRGSPAQVSRSREDPQRPRLVAQVPLELARDQEIVVSRRGRGRRPWVFDGSIPLMDR